jgi:phage shock protein PspC (stress-responsive transcriptional regulator)
MLCPKCSKEVADGSKFCYNCGAQLAGQAASTAATYAEPPKRLMRSSRDKKLGGVCAGLAEYFDLDPTIVRVVWLLAFLCAGAGGLVYIVLWIVLPLAPATEAITAAPVTPARV